MMWIKANPNGRQNPIDMGYGGEGTFTIEANGIISYYWGPNGGYSNPYQWFGSGSKIKWNEWTHVALTRDLQNKKLFWYINGIRTATGTPKYSNAGGTTRRKLGYGYVNNLNGELKDIKLYNRALSAAEVKNFAQEPGAPVIKYGYPAMSVKGQLVTLSGVAKIIDEKNKHVAKIPEEFRPNRNLEFWTNQNDGSALIVITQGGDIYYILLMFLRDSSHLTELLILEINLSNFIILIKKIKVLYINDIKTTLFICNTPLLTFNLFYL